VSQTSRSTANNHFATSSSIAQRSAILPQSGLRRLQSTVEFSRMAKILKIVKTINRKALLFAIVIETVLTLIATFCITLHSCHGLLLAIRILHMPSTALYLGVTRPFDLPPGLDNCLATIFAFCVQTWIWYALLIGRKYRKYALATSLM
jgi:hypothetical protein